ncbi:MAG: elongation factor 1-beta [Candidatus Micrarchaeia archaeon]
MANVVAQIRVMPQDMEAFEKMKNEIEKKIKPYRIEEVPIAFGLKAIRITLLLEDDAGFTKIEEQIRNLDGVGEIEVEQVSRI